MVLYFCTQSIFGLLKTVKKYLTLQNKGKYSVIYPFQSFALSVLFRNKSLRVAMFRRYLLLRLSIILALNMQSTILCYYIYKITYNASTHKGDTLALGLMGLWEVLPAVGFSFISGYFVDKAEKKSIFVKCVVGYLALALFFVLLSIASGMQGANNSLILYLCYLGIFAGGVLRAFISPASFALFGVLLPRKLYANATTWSSAAWETGAVTGPLLGSLFIALWGFIASFTAVFVIEIASLLLILSIPKQAKSAHKREPILQSLAEGLKFVFRTPVILASLSLDMFAVLFGGAVALLPVFTNELLHVGELGFGWLRSAPGIGSILMLMVFSWYPLKRNPGIKLLAGIAGFGITTIVFGYSAFIADTGIMGSILGCPISYAFLLAFAMLLAGGMCDAISVVIRGTILQLHTPENMRGRVASVATMFISSSNELGAMESGLTARWMGTVVSVVFGGFMTLVVVATTWFAAPSLTKLQFGKKEN
ncbi:MAG: MFS transporter [Chitinophagia bacterium]|nr:MFS transporter [Chitinophagia bacterium]